MDAADGSVEDAGPSGDVGPLVVALGRDELTAEQPDVEVRESTPVSRDDVRVAVAGTADRAGAVVTGAAERRLLDQIESVPPVLRGDPG